jgi:hypothetical protein
MYVMVVLTSWVKGRKKKVRLGCVEAKKDAWRRRRGQLIVCLKLSRIRPRELGRISELKLDVEENILGTCLEAASLNLSRERKRAACATVHKRF